MHPGFSFQYKCILKTRINIIQLPAFQQLHQVITVFHLRMATQVSILKYRVIIEWLKKYIHSLRVLALARAHLDSYVKYRIYYTEFNPTPKLWNNRIKSFFVIVKIIRLSGIATCWTAGVRFPEEAKFSLDCSVQNDIGAHTASYPMGVGCKVGQAWSWSFSSIYCRGQDCWSYISTPPHMS
jgi:hypothetical protein